MPRGGGSNLKMGVAHGEHRARAYKGFWGRSPQRGPGAEPLVRGRSSPEAERFLGIIRRKDSLFTQLLKVLKYLQNIA